MIILAVFSALLIATLVSCDGNVEPSPSTDDRSTPLTLENNGTSPVTVTVTIHGFSSEDFNLEYSKNGGVTPTSIVNRFPEVTEINLNAGETVSFYGDRGSIVGSAEDYVNIDCSNSCCVYGNVMSLIDSDDFATLTSVNAYAFYYLFFGTSNIKNHGSRSIVLPATTLAEGCYYGMFYGCSGLTSAPALPAETLANSCYRSMFNGCTSLTTAPVLPALTLVDYCYSYMFNGCSVLNSITCLATTNVVYPYTESWVSGVPTTSGTFIKNASFETTDPNYWTTGSHGIPSSNWHVEDYTE